MQSIPTPMRRGVLKATGLTLALPMLESTADQQTAAASATNRDGAKAKRLVCIGTYLGLYRPAFYPESTGQGYKDSTLLSELAQHRNDYTVFSGFDHRSANGHGNWDNYLCGKRVGDISLDQLAAEQIGQSTQIPSLQLCAGDIPRQKMVFTRQGTPLPMINRPSVVYHKLFASDEDRRRSKHLLETGRSALDIVHEDANRLSKRVSTSDRKRLDEYFTSLRELEQRMHRQLEHLENEAPTTHYKLPAFDPVAPTLMLECEQIMMDMIALALQTDATRVATLFIAGLGQVFTLDGRTMRAGYHALSHHGNDPDLIRDLIRVEQEHMRCLNRLLTSLKEKTDEQGRPLLDTTMVMFGTGMGDASRHSNRDLPTLVAGGGLRHGRHIAANPKTDQLLLGDVFLTMLRQLGIETDQFSDASGGIDHWT